MTGLEPTKYLSKLRHEVWVIVTTIKWASMLSQFAQYIDKDPLTSKGAEDDWKEVKIPEFK